MSSERMRLPSCAFTATIAARLRQRPPAATATTVDTFVRGILARHTGRRGACAPLDRIVRRAGPTVARLVTARRALSVALRIDVRPWQTVHVREATRPFLAWRRAATALVVTAPAAASPPDLIERIFQRERRVDSTATIRSLVERVVAERGRGPASVRSAPAPAWQAPAVPMIVRHLPPATEAASGPAAPDAPMRPRREARTARPEPADSRTVTPIPLSQSELRDLSERVVDIIDRRFVAHRERHGRI